MKDRYVLSGDEMAMLVKMAGRAGAAEYRREHAREDRKSGKVEITRERLKGYRRAKLALAEKAPLPEEVLEIRFKALSDLMDVRDPDSGLAARIIRADTELRQKNAHDILMLERAVELYGRECEQSKKEEVKRRFRALELMHLGEEEMTVEEIAAELGTGERSVYRDLNAAYAAVSEYYLGLQ